VFFAIATCSILIACRGDSSHRAPGDLTQAENDDRVGQKVVRCGIEEIDPNKVEDLNDMLSLARIKTNDAHRPIASVIVPVIVHIIASGPSAEEGMVSDAQLEAQMQVLNSAYSGASGGASTPFQFVIVGVTRTINPYWASMTLGSSAEAEAKAALREGGRETLNLYLAAPPDGTLGWATFPWDYDSDPLLDGVVVLFDSIPGGALPPYNEGDTATHEIGHWLGLFHTFQGECSDLNDTIGDTPAEERPAYGCPVGRNTCSPSDAPDSVNNYMNYSDDYCLFEFSPEQADRIDVLGSDLRGL